MCADLAAAPGLNEAQATVCDNLLYWPITFTQVACGSAFFTAQEVARSVSEMVAFC